MDGPHWIASLFAGLVADLGAPLTSGGGIVVNKFTFVRRAPEVRTA